MVANRLPRDLPHLFRGCRAVGHATELAAARGVLACASSVRWSVRTGHGLPRLCHRLQAVSPHAVLHVASRHSAAPDAADRQDPDGSASRSAPPSGGSIAGRFEADEGLCRFTVSSSPARTRSAPSGLVPVQVHETCAYSRNRDDSRLAGADPGPDDWRTQEHAYGNCCVPKKLPPELQQILAAQDATVSIRIAATSATLWRRR